MAARQGAGRLRRWIIDPAKAVAGDYKRSLESMRDWARESPVRVAAYGLATASAVYAAQNNITEEDFHSVIAKNAALIAEVPPSLRNPASEAHVTRLNEARLAHTLRRVDLIFASLFYIGDYPPTLKIFKAEHYFFHEFVRTFPDRITEFSVLGLTPMTDRSMVDYDVNDSDEHS